MGEITVDDRAGSRDWYPDLNRSGLPVRLGRLNFGDVAFMGRGEDDCPVPIGIEVKRIRDLLGCICDGRFAGHQLPGLVQSFEQVYLLVEGQWRAGSEDGRLQVLSNHGVWVDASIGGRKFRYTDVATWISTITIKGGVSVQRVLTWREATLWLSSLYKWWVTDGWDWHKAHLSFNNSGMDRFRDRAVLVRPSVCRLVAAQLPGIGYDKSAALEKFFGSVATICAAEPWELAQVPGIGMGLATKIYNAIHQGGR